MQVNSVRYYSEKPTIRTYDSSKRFVGKFISWSIARGLNASKLKLKSLEEPKDPLATFLSQCRFGDCWRDDTNVSFAELFERRRFDEYVAREVEGEPKLVLARGFFGDRFSLGNITVDPEGFTLISYFRNLTTLIVWSFGCVFSSKKDSSVDAKSNRRNIIVTITCGNNQFRACS